MTGFRRAQTRRADVSDGHRNAVNGRHQQQSATDGGDDGECARDHVCSRCATSFPTERFLAQHLAPDRKRCRVCCKRFRNTSNVVSHERVHTGEKPYACPVCRKAFAQMGNLRTHQRSHASDRPYACDVCHRRFVQKGNLTKHSSTHSRDKPYACDVCPKSYCQRYQLVRHQLKH
ncbi:zinc finger protein 568-like [Sipha flava]|uniref:Zinc finger protein n=1 Tax=Sipha flava TaxID=143950 RepID=A0A2S2Q7G8_9HEMI|nr:zinc finger protein 568-like [Sipha flava]